MSLKNLRFKSRMLILVGIFLAVLVATHFMYGVMLAVVRVNGPLYERISQGKDIVSELVSTNNDESYIGLVHLLDEANPARRREFIKRLETLEAEYQAKHKFLEKNLEEGPLKEALVVKCYVPGIDFYITVNEKVIAPLRSGMKLEEVASPELRRMMRDLHDQRSQVLADATKVANARISADEQAAQHTMRNWITTQIILGLAGLGILLALSWIVVRGIVAPTDALIDRMKDMAQGASDLTKRVEVHSRDEIGQLAGFINAVIQRIHDLIARVRVATIQLNSTATEIAASASEQNSTVQGFNVSTTEVAAAAKEITATSQELSATMEDVRCRAHDTAALAETGREGLLTMEGTMKKLAEATGSISVKLGTIREKAGGINMVVTTITKVADQTNLLSINAAIEAEKAGEAGRGFLVVAREIRRLADQTAVATLDIEQLVRHMQGAVSAGVMEMDKFSEEVRSCGKRVAEVSGQTGQIIEQVQTLSQRFQVVSEGMKQQTQGARQIGEAIVQLDAGVKQVSTSAREFTAAAENLRHSAQGLQQEIGQFTVAG